MNKLPDSMMMPAKRKSSLKAGIIRVNLDDNRLYLYDISNFLIERVGRLCESYQTDFLISWDSFIQDVKEHTDGIHYFGIRESGVDGDMYVCNSVMNDDMARYRSLYSVEFHRVKKYDEDIICYRINKEWLRKSPTDFDFDIDTLNDEIHLSTEELLETFPWLKEVAEDENLSILR